MICGDLDLERARRDRKYRRMLYAFLVLKPRLQLTAIGFPELRRGEFQLHQLKDPLPQDDLRKQASAG